jgi:predicted membrane metal-binding protein
MIDRLWCRAAASAKSESLADCAKISLAEVRHQIWLLKNVFWWYLLPPGIGLAVVGIDTAYQLWLRSGSLLLSNAVAVCFFLVVVVVDVFIYRLNQRTVRNGLEPRVRELESMLSSFDETHTDLSPD